MQWLTIPGYPMYQVSDDGQVLSLYSNKVLKQFEHTMYKAVGPYRDGKSTHIYVHQLVLLAFIGPCPEGMEVCHNDGNSHNNHLTNLRYDTRKNNTKDRLLHGNDHNSNKTHCLRGHEYTPENTYLDAKGNRSCKTCRRAAYRDWKRRKKSTNYQGAQRNCVF